MKIAFLSFFIITNLCGAERPLNFTTNLQDVVSLNPYDIYFIQPKHYYDLPLTISSLFFPNNKKLIIQQDSHIARKYFTWWDDEQINDDVVLLNLTVQDLQNFQIYEPLPRYCLVHHTTCKQLAEVINKVNFDTVFACYQMDDVQKNDLKKNLTKLYTTIYGLEKILDSGDYYDVTNFLSSFFNDLHQKKNYAQSFKIFLTKNKKFFVRVHKVRKQYNKKLIFCAFGLFLMVTCLRYCFNNVNEGHENGHYNACARCAEHIKFESDLNNVIEFVFNTLVLQGMQGLLLGISVYKIYQHIVHTIRYKQLETVIAALENQIIEVHEIE